MYSVFKFLHFIGLTLFLGSIWVYIAEGTPMEIIPITQYVRMTIMELIEILTIPGLVLMIISGFGMLLLRRSLLKSRFFKIKLTGSIIVLLNACYILFIAKQAVIAAGGLPLATDVLQGLVLRETIFGAFNVLIILFLIGYTISTSKKRMLKI